MWSLQHHAHLPASQAVFAREFVAGLFLGGFGALVVGWSFGFCLNL